MDSNPVTVCLDQLGEKWMAFEKSSKAPCAIWKVRPDESSMIDAFALYEDTEAGQVPSVFFVFETDFERPENYAAKLIDEFFLKLHHPTSRQEFEEAGMPVTQLKAGQAKDDAAWLALMKDFFDQLCLYLEVDDAPTSFVAYLCPKNNHNPVAWTWWLESILDRRLPPSLRFMLKDDVSAPVLDKVIGHFPHKTEVLHADIDMGQLMLDTFEDATKGKEEEPGVKLQKALLEVGQYAGEKNMPQAEQAAQAALKIAQKEKWGHLEVATHIMLAGGYLGLQDRETALKKYGDARSAARAFAEEDEAMSQKMEAQALMGVAGCHLGLQNLEAATAAYAEAGAVSEAAEQPTLALEGWRMAGYCAATAKDLPTAWAHYFKAKEVGKTMDADTLKTTTFADVGSILVDDLAKQLDEKEEGQGIEEEYVKLLGENWRDFIKTPSK